VSTDTFTAQYDRYLEAVGEPDPGRRASLLAESTTDDVTIVSPAYVVAGRANVIDKLGELMAQFDSPLRMQRVGAPEGHHSLFRARWSAVTAAGVVVVTGQHFVEVSDGRLLRVVVFVDAAADDATKSPKDDNQPYEDNQKEH
jgi:hypothetical protein